MINTTTDTVNSNTQTHASHAWHASLTTVANRALKYFESVTQEF